MMIGITGAGGFIGKHITLFLNKSGYSVVALQRSIPPISRRVSGVDYRFFDLSNVTEVVFKDITHIIHCAYSYEDTAAEVGKGINFLAAQHIVQIAKKQGIRLFFISSIMVESRAKSLYCQQKRMIESILDKSCHTIIRPGFVLGDGGVGLRLGRIASTWPIIPCITDGSQLLHVVPISSICSSIVSIIRANETGLIYFAHHEALSFRAFMESVSRRVKGRRPIFINIPFFIAYFGAYLADIFSGKKNYFQERVRGLRDISHKNFTPSNYSQWKTPGSSLPKIIDDFSDVVAGELHSSDRSKF